MEECSICGAFLICLGLLPSAAGRISSCICSSLRLLLTAFDGALWQSSPACHISRDFNFGSMKIKTSLQATQLSVCKIVISDRRRSSWLCSSSGHLSPSAAHILKLYMHQSMSLLLEKTATIKLPVQDDLQATFVNLLAACWRST